VVQEILEGEGGEYRMCECAQMGGGLAVAACRASLSLSVSTGANDGQLKENSL